MAMISGTLWLSWQLEGAAAAINDAGSLRMRATRVAVELQKPAPNLATHRARVDAELERQDLTLAQLVSGNPARPLFLPSEGLVQQQMTQVLRYWQTVLKPAAAISLQTGSSQPYLQALPEFIRHANQLVLLVEQNNERKNDWLRLSQGVLALVACTGTLAMIYLLYLWIILPVLRLQQGLQKMARHEFGVRLPIESRDEFGMLAGGFNQMADELEGLYRDLEARVRDKTAQLAAQNRELSALYETEAFLNQEGDIETLCRGFLQRVMALLSAEGGSLRVLDGLSDKLHLMVSEGLSDALVAQENCTRVHDCLCGEASQSGVVLIRDFRQRPRADGYRCSKEGFAALAAFQIIAADQVLGTFALHFHAPRDIGSADSQLLRTLGQRLGAALLNRRLSAKARQLAVVEERSLVAQGLHDSIAQGLNFLNLQVQMLDLAARADDMAEVREIVPLLKTGVEESYQDVRELLLNFRSKLGPGELLSGIEDTVARFRRQCSAEVVLNVHEQGGAPLPPEQQLQVLFILQEALSNVRKHAGASKVEITMLNGSDFVLQVRDNGEGYDPVEVASRAEGHIGLHIIQERAHRLNANLTLESVRGEGSSLLLQLPQSVRQAA
ncbi:type IV pili methyl-accepting chemotaxis transducer N-terminal domain-containing protein [Craterilacuibacter sp. RT1T]|uniref:type IV pili methyl-accepting chemotaxis transducer N-terminal domain-containing protein n=1 Tax=Craterilacuibacter sp. RT1T TaxID=2942211 RepID=UPI0020C17A69|nr:type IV pili methyl-accepting chemotaxis transducer N-terminal domain-containing protein [Craterilacuibacter sp. RT1T]MCL6264728.1 type IV pili methyl-accepting chemotaxis transducer N-terminal domain-containing protein [Craterilacuibacter sp. RT1T]